MLKRVAFLFLLIAITLSACGTLEVEIEASIPTLTPPSPIVVTATPGPIIVTATTSPSPGPSSPALTATLTATPSSTPASAACDRAALVSDVTVSDGTVFTPNTIFTKTWRLKNTGTCAWTTAYRLIFIKDHQMGGPTSMNLPSTVFPNSTVDLSIRLSAPPAEGSYRGYWALANASGTMFGVGSTGDKPFWVEIVVSNETRTYRDSQFDLIFDYPSTWYVQSIMFGVLITSFDPANPPHKLEWTPSTISMRIESFPIGWEADAFPPPSSDELLDGFVKTTKQQALASYLEIIGEERLTIAGSPAARVSVASGSGGTIHYVEIVIDDGGPVPGIINVSIEGPDFELARRVLDTLRRP